MVGRRSWKRKDGWWSHNAYTSARVFDLEMMKRLDIAMALRTIRGISPDEAG